MAEVPSFRTKRDAEAYLSTVWADMERGHWISPASRRVTVRYYATAGWSTNPTSALERSSSTRESVPDAALICGLGSPPGSRPDLRSRTELSADIDFVMNDDAAPTLIEIITARQDTPEPTVIDGIKVHVILTYDMTEADLPGIDHGPRLFLASHRWAPNDALTMPALNLTARRGSR